MGVHWNRLFGATVAAAVVAGVWCGGKTLGLYHADLGVWHLVVIAYVAYLWGRTDGEAA